MGRRLYSIRSNVGTAQSTSVQSIGQSTSVVESQVNWNLDDRQIFDVFYPVELL